MKKQQNDPLQPFVLMVAMHSLKYTTQFKKLMTKHSVPELQVERIFYGRESVASYLNVSVSMVNMNLLNKLPIRGHQIIKVDEVNYVGSTPVTTVPEIMECDDLHTTNRYWVYGALGDQLSTIDLAPLTSPLIEAPSGLTQDEISLYQHRLGLLPMGVYRIFGPKRLRVIKVSGSDFIEQLRESTETHLKEHGDLLNFTYELGDGYTLRARRSTDMSKDEPVTESPSLRPTDIKLNGSRVTLSIDEFIGLAKRNVRQLQAHIPLIVNSEFLLGNLAEMAGTALYSTDDARIRDRNALDMRELRLLTLFLPYLIQDAVNGDLNELSRLLLNTTEKP